MSLAHDGICFFQLFKTGYYAQNPAKGLSDGSDPIRQHGVQGQVLAVAANVQGMAGTVLLPAVGCPWCGVGPEVS